MSFMDWVIPGFFVALALLVPRYGADSRGPVPVRTHTVSGDVRRIGRVLRRFAVDQTHLWERWGQEQRPWEREPLAWTHVRGQWRLSGRLLPGADDRRGR